jgi:hypothetical protein
LDHPQSVYHFNAPAILSNGNFLIGIAARMFIRLRDPSVFPSGCLFDATALDLISFHDT